MHTVKPVPLEFVRAVNPYISLQVRVLILRQILTAARGGELVILRLRDVAYVKDNALTGRTLRTKLKVTCSLLRYKL